MRKSSYVMVFPVRDNYLLINGLSGAIKLVSKETAQKFSNGEVTEELKPFFTHLTPDEERKKAENLCGYLMRNAATCADSTIAVTYDCNLRCPYCYEIWVKQPETMRMVIDKHKVDKIFEAAEMLNRNCTGEKPITLTGGEPLMKRNRTIVRYILKKGNDLGYTFTIFTNGVELNHFLSDLSSVLIHHMQITLDGPPSIHNKRRIFRKGKDTFDTIVKHIEEARKMGLPLLIRTNSDPEILSKIGELAAFFKEKKWTEDPNIGFSLAYLCEQTIDPETADQVMEVYEKVIELSRNPELNFFEPYPFKKLRTLLNEHPRFWPSFWNCNAVTKRYVFDPFGDIYPCRGTLGWKEQRIGVYTPELVFNEKHDAWRKRTIFNVGRCAECEIALVCGGGCGYASLLNEKDLFIPVCFSIERGVIDYLKYLYDRKKI